MQGESYQNGAASAIAGELRRHMSALGTSSLGRATSAIPQRGEALTVGGFHGDSGWPRKRVFASERGRTRGGADAYSGAGSHMVFTASNVLSRWHSLQRWRHCKDRLAAFRWL